MSSTFAPATWRFLDDLAADNTKATFEDRRDAYEADVVAPSVALVEALAGLLPERVHPGLQADPAVGRSRFRLHRDLRFAKDKTPFHTHLDFLFWLGAGPARQQPACILRLTSTEVLLGAGQLGLRGEALDRYRTRLVDPVEGAAVRAIVEGRRAAGAVLSDPARARVPRPYAADDPSAELLRRDGFHLTTTQPHPEAIVTDACASWCAERWAPYAPLLDWLAA